jgi:endonuclease/exonuclease/phosphatase family metal-dependent hydrolase
MAQVSQTAPAVKPIRVSVQTVALAIALYACGGSSPTEPGSAAAAAGPEFKVMTFNIAHGLNGRGKYGLDAAAQAIASVQPDLVGIQEFTRNHPAYQCEDQPAKLAELLTSMTGRRWNAAYHQEWFTQIRDCQNSGRGDGPATEGLGFLSPEPVTTQHTPLWNGRLGLMTNVNRGRQVPVVVTHLAHSAANVSDRMRQLDGLLPWVTGLPRQGGQILMGDMNLWPDSPEYQRIREHYRDAWLDGVEAGVARGRMDGVTHKTVRIDYIFYTGPLQLVSIENVENGGPLGSPASDHNPVVAVFRLK